MGLVWEDILAWDAVPLYELSEELREARRIVTQQTDEVTAALTGFRSTGETAEVVRERLSGHQDALAELTDELGQVQQALVGAVAEVRQVQRLVEEVKRLSAARQYREEDGGVAMATTNDPEVQELIRRALLLAENVDAELVAVAAGRAVKPEPERNPLIRYVIEQREEPRRPSLREQYPDLEDRTTIPPRPGFGEYGAVSGPTLSTDPGSR